jgi:hypothetical protein
VVILNTALVTSIPNAHGKGIFPLRLKRTCCKRWGQIIESRWGICWREGDELGGVLEDFDAEDKGPAFAKFLNEYFGVGK